MRAVTILTLSAFAVGLALAAQAQAAKKAGPNQCFLTRSISNFSAPNDRTVYVRVNVNDYYRLDLMGSCTGISFSHRLALKTTPGRSWICSPLDATVINRQGGINQRCPVTAIHRLTPAEVAALPKRDKP